MSLAAKLPYDHAYAGGYPGIGSQPLPTDADALDYLARVKAADGAGVEVGVATAVDAFFKELKATSGLFEAIKASCILCGARTITGALVPLAGPAPTAQGAWASGDYSRTEGMTGDGNALYLDANVANNSDFGGTVADPQNDQHVAIYVTSAATNNTYSTGVGTTGNGVTNLVLLGSTEKVAARSRSNTDNGGLSFTTGLAGVSRDSSASYDSYADGLTNTTSTASQTPVEANIFVFNTGASTPTNATLAFYSIGTSLSLEDLDTAVTNLITAIGEAL